jgi:uncharacterized protein (DUF4415 family)
MKKAKPLTDDAGEVRELTAVDLRRFRRAEKILPPPLMRKLSGSRPMPGEAVGTEQVTIRLSRDVVEKFRATGEGWQTRLDAALRDWLQTHSPG